MVGDRCTDQATLNHRLVLLPGMLRTLRMLAHTKLSCVPLNFFQQDRCPKPLLPVSSRALAGMSSQ